MLISFSNLKNSYKNKNWILFFYQKKEILFYNLAEFDPLLFNKNNKEKQN